MNKTILIIDDDDILRTTLAHGLRNENFHIITAHSAEDGLETLSRITPDAIILDRMMTGMDGLTLLKQLRACGNNTPVIILTAMNDAENVIDGLAGGANDYLAKPFQMRELILRLHNITRQAPTPDDAFPQGGISVMNDEYFIACDGNQTLLTLSGEEKKLLTGLITPLGNIVPAAPMVVKRLRSKLNIVSSELDIITVRGRGYRLVCTPASANKTNGH